MATLAAYDIRKQLLEREMKHVEVVCYSFGAPRTGNHNFARDYNRMVPDTWSIINNQVCLQHLQIRTVPNMLLTNELYVCKHALLRHM